MTPETVGLQVRGVAAWMLVFQPMGLSVYIVVPTGNVEGPFYSRCHTAFSLIVTMSEQFIRSVSG